MTPHARPEGMTPHTRPEGITPHTRPVGMTPHTRPEGMTPHTREGTPQLYQTCMYDSSFAIDSLQEVTHVKYIIKTISNGNSDFIFLFQITKCNCYFGP